MDWSELQGIATMAARSLVAIYLIGFAVLPVYICWAVADHRSEYARRRSLRTTPHRGTEHDQCR